MALFTGKMLRDLLPVFTNECRFSPSPDWKNYFDTYDLGDILSSYHVSVGLVESSEHQLAVYSYQQVQRPAAGTVIIVHGYMDHAGLYTKIIRQLLALNWNVLSYDLPGHGVSSGDAHAILHFSEYALQLQRVLNLIPHADHGPMVLMGQSTGGAIILEHHRLYPQSDDSILHRILLAPLVRPSEYRLIQAKYLLLKPFLNRVKRYHSDNSHDSAFLSFIRNEDPLQQQTVSVDWIGAMLEWVPLIEQSEVNEHPLTVIQGTADTTVDWQHNLSIISKIYPHSVVRLIDEGRHHLVNEADAWFMQVWEAVEVVLRQVESDWRQRGRLPPDKIRTNDGSE